MTYVVESLPTVLVGLTFGKGVAPYDMGVDGEVSQFGDALGDFLTLVVTSLLQTVGCEWNRDNAIDVIEEVDSRALLRQEPSHVKGYFGAMSILELIKNVASEGMPLVIE